MRFQQTQSNKLVRVREFERPVAKRVSKFAVGSNQYRKTRKTARESHYTATEGHVWLTSAFLLFGILGLSFVHSALNTYVSPLPRTQLHSTVYAAEQPMVESDKIEEESITFLRRVRILESSNGKNTNPEALHNICKERGMVNTVGYGGMQGINGEKFCFDSAEQEAYVVTKKYKERRATMTEAEVYCVWNIGVKTEDCEYYRKAVSL